MTEQITQKDLDIAFARGQDDARIERNKEDIKGIFRRLDRLPFWILGSILIPTSILIYQVATKTPIVQ